MRLRRALRSYRVRIPLSLIAASALTTVVLAAVIAGQTWRNVERDLVSTGRQLGQALATAVKPALRHDDVWQAFNTLRGSEGALFDERTTLVVVDDELRVFAANRPQAFPTAKPLDEAAPGFEGIAGALDGIPSEFLDLPRALEGRRVLVEPIHQDGVAIGALLLIYPDTLMWPRFRDITGDAALSILALMALLAPLGWLWGKRMSEPLTALTRSMARVGHDPPGQIRAPEPMRDDEIGALTGRFRGMLDALREKEAMEARLVRQERLATIGELAGGVAHEINNPLNGLMVAVDTLRRRSDDADVHHTADLLERGLAQIRETVSALLVEARVDGHPFTAQDAEDVRTLAVSHHRGGVLEWDNRLHGPIPLPATPVRQVLLNLLLNAMEASGPEGHVRCTLEAGEATLVLRVANSGAAIPVRRRDALFRPPHVDGGSGGLGLWVTDQIVRGLNGRIEVESDESCTLFRVELPFTGDNGGTPPAGAGGG
ncbi:sensor histidine kinase [Arhodomonas sp. SL1]|uniref:sensor histidine kinase n=1 Tax=Arhodomonas sp. SL1 TaxID=3425691 RepID=UPI003F882860